MMTSYLEDFMEGTELRLQNVSHPDVLTWKHGPPDSLTKVLVSDSTIDDILMAGAVIEPQVGRGVHIIGGAGSIESFKVEYPEDFNLGNYGVDVQGPWDVGASTIINPQIGILLRYMGAAAVSNQIVDAEEDHIRFMSGGVWIHGNDCIGHKDTGCKNHRDLIQGVAANYGATKEDFLDMPIIAVSIRGNNLDSRHTEAQGIMFSDGVAIDWHIDENNISVPSTHGITLNRAQGVDIEDNTTNSYINIGSRKRCANESANVGIEGNTAKGVVLVDCDPKVVTRFERNYDLEGNLLNLS